MSAEKNGAISAEQNGVEIAPAKGKLGVLLVGLGAVSTTFVAGVEAIKRGLAEPIGSLTQMGTIRLGKRTENRIAADQGFRAARRRSNDLVFGAWDIFPDNAYDAAMNAGVLEKDLLAQLKTPLQTIKPMPAVFDQNYVKRLNGTNVKKGKNKMELAEQLIEDIAEFKRKNKCSRLVMVWAASTEIFLKPHAVHKTLEVLRAGDARQPQSDRALDDLRLRRAQVGRALRQRRAEPDGRHSGADRARRRRTACPICGKDFKTGQTLMKTILAPGLKSRMLGLDGWYSTNILGNRDGEVLDDPESFKTKEESKLSVLEHILQPEVYPELYKDFSHVVRINYYPPRGDNKEGWDNIDIFGWLGYPMQIKIDFLCRDSILAAPLVLDLALFIDLAQRAGMKGIQEWLSFYFKAPLTAPGLYPEHDIFIQLMKLKNTLRHLRGEDLITHLGLEYYD